MPAENRRELSPALHPHRLLDRTAGSDADEARNIGADAFEDTGIRPLETHSWRAGCQHLALQ